MDVKFPFNNYQLYSEASTEEEREKYKKAFLKDVKNRIKEIQTRDYINPEENTVDYVILFIPNEQIFSFINEVDRSLIDEAMKGRTILCSPLSLYAVLSVIRQSIDNFSMESRSKEAIAIFSAIKTQWEKFTGQMKTVKDRFDSVHTGFDELVGARERQLDRQFMKLEDLKISTPPQTELIDVTAERVPRKQLTEANS